MKNKKKIFIVVSNHKYSLKNRMPLIEKLNKEYEITICLPFKNDLDKKFLKKYNLIFFQLGRNYLSIIFDLLGFLILYFKIRKNKPTHILNFSTKPVFLFSFINKIMLSKIIVINTFTGLGRFFFTVKNDCIHKLICKLCFNNKQIFIFQNKNNLKQIAKFLPKFSKTHLIKGSGIKSNILKYQTKKINNLCFIGRLNEDKCIIELMKAFNHIDNVKYKSVLKIAGPIDFYYKKTHKKFLELLKQNKNIYYLGEVNNTQTLLTKNKFFILPSLHEGVPVTILEAMSSYTMILINKWDGYENIIKFYTKEVCIKKRSNNYVESIYKSLINALELKPSKYKEIVLKYKSYFEENFSIDIIFKSYKSIIDK